METARKNASRAEETGNSPQTDNGLYEPAASHIHKTPADVRAGPGSAVFSFCRADRIRGGH